MKANILEKTRELRIKETEKEFLEFYQIKLRKLEEEIRREDLIFR